MVLIESKVDFLGWVYFVIMHEHILQHQHHLLLRFTSLFLRVWIETNSSNCSSRL